MTSPETQSSLLLRVRNSNDAAAWDEFVQIYQPVIYRMARIRGLQPADADDLTQQVLIAVSSAVDRWEPDESRGRFRTWLLKVAQNAILNALSRGVRDLASADQAIELLLKEFPDRDPQHSSLLQIEYSREIFQQAASQIRTEFTDDTWNSFWLTAVEGLDVEQAASRLGRSRGSVYASRSRVMKRLKQKVDEYDEYA